MHYQAEVKKCLQAYTDEATGAKKRTDGHFEKNGLLVLGERIREYTLRDPSRSYLKPLGPNVGIICILGSLGYYTGIM